MSVESAALLSETVLGRFCARASVPRGEPGKYMFTFSGIGECMVSVSAKTKDGVKSQGPPFKFRVKPLPKPEARIGGKFAPDEMKKSELATVGAIGAGASGFDFQANYITLEYEILGTSACQLVQAAEDVSELD